MTYRELIEICNATPDEECKRCDYKKECAVFTNKTDDEMPVAFYNALGIDFDAEISGAETVEVTYCKDCTHYDGEVKFPYCRYHDINVNESDYCSRAKRKEEEE